MVPDTELGERSEEVIGVIMAGGFGSRLRRDGITIDKPLVPVGGQPIVQWVLDDMRAAGVREVGVVCRADQYALKTWLRNFAAESSLRVEFLCQPCNGTLAAVKAGLAWAPGTVVLSTCDVAAPRGTVARLLTARTGAGDKPAATLASTTLVHDPQPIWISVTEEGFIRNIGKSISPTGICFGHVRVLRPGFRSSLVQHEPGLTRDTEALGRIARADHQAMIGVDCGDIVDVDEMSDIELAEKIVTPSL